MQRLIVTKSRVLTLIVDGLAREIQAPVWFYYQGAGKRSIMTLHRTIKRSDAKPEPMSPAVLKRFNERILRKMQKKATKPAAIARRRREERLRRLDAKASYAA